MRTCVPPLKSTPSGMWCQNRMLSTPRTEKIRENPRKNHFFPSQSIFVVRNSSTLLNPQRRLQRPPQSLENLNRQSRAAFLLLKNCVEDHARYQNCSKQVGEQTKGQRNRKPTHRTRTKQEQDHRRTDRCHVRINDRHPRMRKPLLYSRRSRLAGPQLFADALED